MRKSVAGFVLGLLGGIGALMISGISVLGSAALFDVGATDSFAFILSWLMFAGSILAIVGASLCFKKARMGGIMLLISAITALAYLGYSIYQMSQVALITSTITLLIFLAIPSILILVGAIVALAARVREPVEK